jgi:adenylate cyclase class 2
MQSAEIELKFPVDDPAHLQSRLPGLGFHLDTPRTFEHNTLYDTAGRTLRQTKQILRLRRYGSLWTLTHKRQPAPSPDAERSAEGATGIYKIRIETETHVDDGPALGAIFEQLGYAPVFHYEKFRTEWSQSVSLRGALSGVDLAPLEADTFDALSLDSGHLVLDETPIGTYAELEGPPAWIDRTLAQLDIDPSICITESYGKLFLAWKERTGSPAEHLTFAQIPTPYAFVEAALR